jgi:hypothetical protein
VGISSLRIREMIQFARADWDVDEHLEAIMDDVRRSLGRLRSQIERSSLFDGHRQVVFRALQHFEQGDHVSAATMLYPRIEGVLRGRHSLIPGVGRVSQDALAAGAAADVDERRHPWSLLLPRRFQTYLKEVYFANFDPANPSGVNRNTIGHGIAPENEINGKASTLAVLILEQITFLCG